LKLDTIDLSALSGAQHLAASGRTSFPVDKSLDRDAYRVLGYKQCGERGVRVDILERLADLIRPALSWRAGALGEKPAGAFDGRSFVVTQAMTSLTGSAGEDFASILRALGYRMEKRPPLPPAPTPAPVEAAPVEAAPAEAAAVEALAAEAGAETALPETAVEASAIAVDAEAAEPAAAVVETSEPAAVIDEVPQVSEEVATAPEAPATETAEPTAVPQEPAVEAAAPEQAPADASVAADAAPTVAVAPELVEVWRPGGRSDERRPRHDRNRPRHQARPQEGAQPLAAEGEAGEGAKRERHGRPRRERNKDFRKPRSDAPAAAVAVAIPDGATPEATQVREGRDDKPRPPRERFEGKGRDRGKFDTGKFAGKPKGDRDGGRSGGGPSHRQYASSAPPRERERPVDPNSPFAKLAALKEQLTAGRKD
jgi:ATP-dependent RNA helicase SUPV3L1/SUV3